MLRGDDLPEVPFPCSVILRQSPGYLRRCGFITEIGQPARDSLVVDVMIDDCGAQECFDAFAATDCFGDRPVRELRVGGVRSGRFQPVLIIIVSVHGGSL
jgi:hypothetical protein